MMYPLEEHYKVVENGEAAATPREGKDHNAEIPLALVPCHGVGLILALGVLGKK